MAPSRYRWSAKTWSYSASVYEHMRGVMRPCSVVCCRMSASPNTSAPRSSCVARWFLMALLFV